MKLATLVFSLSLIALPLHAAEHKEHQSHTAKAHTHKAGCGHEAVKHGDHTDYMHDGQFHTAHEKHYDVHGTDDKVASHDHVHGKDCGHKEVQHGDHMDFEHDGHFHAAHDKHFDDHGVMTATAGTR